MTFKSEAVINVLIGFFMLSGAMTDRRLAVTLAIVFLIGLAIYQFAQRPKKLL